MKGEKEKITIKQSKKRDRELVAQFPRIMSYHFSSFLPVYLYLELMAKI